MFSFSGSRFLFLALGFLRQRKIKNPMMDSRTSDAVAATETRMVFLFDVLDGEGLLEPVIVQVTCRGKKCWSDNRTKIVREFVLRDRKSVV